VKRLGEGPYILGKKPGSCAKTFQKKGQETKSIIVKRSKVREKKKGVGSDRQKGTMEDPQRKMLRRRGKHGSQDMSKNSKHRNRGGGEKKIY